MFFVLHFLQNFTFSLLKMWTFLQYILCLSIELLDLRLTECSSGFAFFCSFRPCNCINGLNDVENICLLLWIGFIRMREKKRLISLHFFRSGLKRSAFNSGLWEVDPQILRRPTYGKEVNRTSLLYLYLLLSSFVKIYLQNSAYKIQG